MEVVAAAPPNGGGVPPFHDHDVREWSRIDSLTGVLERARLETDHWTANTNNASHKYNKVVDSRARTQADGALQQNARRQLEVYQSQIPGGHLQVIKTHTVSTSRWSNKTTTGDLQKIGGDFENLQLSVNPIDLSSEKSKATVGRSCGRRPPSRPRLKDDSGLNCQRSAQEQAAVNLYRVSRLCHQIHDQTVKQTIGRHQNQKTKTPPKLEIEPKPLTRTKSTSSEDIHLISPDKDKTTKSIEDLEDLEQLQSWRRTSKLRRSLQFPKTTTKSKPADLPENSGTVRKIREELEKGRRLNTALRGNNVDLEALDQILQTISSSSSDKTSIDDSQDQDKKQKRNSFVTVETLQEVRGRLRRTSSPTFYQQSNKDEEIDDGIVTEETNDTSAKSRVRSYVYGMETMLNKKPTINGTGSLESRSKLTNGNTNLRTEDWYNRRKSYGFEQMHNQNESTNSLNNKNRVESSTDSGICRSTEIAIVPTSKPESPIKEFSNNNVKQISSIFDRKHDIKATTITIPIKSNDFNNWNDPPEIKRHSIAVDESKYVQTIPETNRYRRTSLAVNDKEFDEAISQNRKLKKVEFCKTEVHFAAESGKVNIVETDEKPPPTNNFRRRRRNSGLLLNDLQNDLPVLHFGDSSYEKSLLGVAVIDDNDDDDDDYQTTIPCGTVTVNTGSNQIELPQRDDDKVDREIDNIKGILKNKPIKPIPYHLGENLFNDGDESGKWGVKLRPINNDPPFWKSTVTLHNTVYNNHQESTNDDQPEFRRLLKNLRPTSLKPDLINHNSDSKFAAPINDRRSWSIADRIKLSNDNQSTENKVYSTRINFDDNGATVIENDFEKNPRTRLKTEDSNQIINKGLVVRIGHDDYTSKHTVCSKTTTTTTQQDTNNTTTTTKITIDLSPSPTTSTTPTTAPFEFNQKSSPILARSHSFKSTSLILDTIKNEKNKIPHQLEVLKKLYEDVQSDSDADKEVQILMGETGNDNDSVVSGSWSKMRAYKTITEHANKTFKFDTNLEKDNSNNNFKYLRSIGEKSGKLLRDSPEKLSSPSLVGKNSPRTDEATDLELFTETKFIKNDVVLRQPKKSEMTYFGVKVASPKPIKKIVETQKTVINANDNKPDLLKHMKDKTIKDEPIYENLNQLKTREFDSKILEELTKAADEILQAVNGFADDKDENSCTEEVAKLETISETKSWSKSTNSTKPTMKQTRSKLRTTPSNSSVESLPKDYKKTNSVRRCLQTTTPTATNERLTRKKTTSDSSNKATTRARRLQRASSREALLQSHGSSSEDLGVNNETPIRKPRQIRKTKTTQLSISNGVEMKKPAANPPRRRREDVKKNDEFLRSSEPLPEIRHKTAVSTIRSTAEKAKLRNEETRKRSTTTKRDTSRVLNSDSKRNSISKEIPTVNHRISTANIKKCQRADGSMRH